MRKDRRIAAVFSFFHSGDALAKSDLLGAQGRIAPLHSSDEQLVGCATTIKQKIMERPWEE